MSEQSTALRLADALGLSYAHLTAVPEINREAAAELRRLHAVNQELTENLEKKSVAIQRIWKERDELRKVNQEMLNALHCISLAAQDSGSTREGMGLYARAAIKKAERQA